MRAGVLAISGAIFTLVLSVGCGGGSSGTTPPGGSGNGPTSGEYLWEVGSDPELSVATISDGTGALGSPTVAGSPTFNDTNYPSIAVSPSNKFLYAFYTSFTELEVFQIGGPGLQLTLLPKLTLFGPAPLVSMTLDPSGKFLYIVQSPATVQEFSVDADSGALTPGSVVTEAADLRMGAIDPAGKFFFVTDLTGGRVFAYQIDQANGSLSAVVGSPFTVPVNGQPSSEVIGGAGKFLYLELISGGVGAFAINSSTGALTDIPGSPFPTIGNEPSFIAADPSGNFIYVSNFQDGSIDAFAVDANNGVLSTVMGSPFSTAPSPSSIAVDPSGKFLYVSIYPDSTIYGFSLDSTTGGLSGVVGSPFPSVPQPTSISTVKIP